jgi:hypothetical protein
MFTMVARKFINPLCRSIEREIILEQKSTQSHKETKETTLVVP